jgi:hypothetical protein
MYSGCFDGGCPAVCRPDGNQTFRDFRQGVFAITTGTVLLAVLREKYPFCSLIINIYVYKIKNKPTVIFWNVFCIQHNQEIRLLVSLHPKFQ